MTPEHVLRAWTRREVAPWRLDPVPLEAARPRWDALVRQDRALAVFRVAHGGASIETSMAADNPFRERAGHYLTFFNEAARLLPPDFTATFCVCLNDVMPVPFDVPVMAFQRTPEQKLILIPDPDFFKYDWFESPAFIDPFHYARKEITGVFAGSTSGRIFDRHDVETLALERLAAAEHFRHSQVVDFRLPHIVQAADAETAALLAARPYCQRPMLSWHEQYRHRFLLSVDGNGATCSRLWLALRSQSVPMKFRSDNLLYYSHGLEPWLHYIPIDRFWEVEHWIDAEWRAPGEFQGIADAGQAYVRAYVSREQVTRFMAQLLAAYAESFDTERALSAA